MEILNLGIVAHVDAGKTSLTERILFETGVIARLGRVDHGDTQTDALALERERGITIAAAVVSFQIGDLKINLIDTPGHPDFIAEVDRALSVLDGVILVVSAVEGVQSQTRRLLFAIQAAGIPVLLFINKIDRPGARSSELLADIRRRLGLQPIPISWPIDPGNPGATVVDAEYRPDVWLQEVVEPLAEGSDALLESYLASPEPLPRDLIEAEFKAQVVAGVVVPAYFGSARTGAGVGVLLEGVRRFLPRADTRVKPEMSARVFKIQRGTNGEKIAIARIDSGTIRVRERIPYQRPNGSDAPLEERITGLEKYERGRRVAVPELSAGEIAVLHGLKDVRIGDVIGDPSSDARGARFHFAPPTLTSVVYAADPASPSRLAITLQRLAEQDPLIDLRTEAEAGKLSISLFGEVQKEVLTETVLREAGVEILFEPSQTLCVERLIGEGSAVEWLGGIDNPYQATIGIRVEPGPTGSGIDYRFEPGSLPTAFYVATEETIHETLAQGRFNWPVVDCRVTLTDVGYNSPVSTAADFRKLTPLVLAQALEEASTSVCEPYERFTLDVPEDCTGDIVSELIKHRAVCRDIEPMGELSRVTGSIPAVERHGFEQLLPGLSRGDGDWMSEFESYEPVTGEPPLRGRVGPNPFNRKHYMADVARR